MSDIGQFTETPALTAIAISYKNPDEVFIADEVLPRVPVQKRSFKWQTYDEADAFTVPNTKVGRRSEPNRVEIEGREKDGSVDDHAIDIPLDNVTIEEAEDDGFDPRNKAVERATDIILLDREIRAANVVTNPDNYHEDNVVALDDGLSFLKENSDPVSIIEEMMDACLIKPNQLTFGQSAWRAIRKHPKIVKAVYKNSGDQGRVTREQLAELLEVNRILVGSARVNINKPGLAPRLERCWGGSVSGQYINRTADTSGGVTFGFTAQHGGRVGGTLSANIGFKGGVLVRSAESVREMIVANRAGFLIKNAV